MGIDTQSLVQMILRAPLKSWIMTVIKGSDTIF